MLFSTGVTGSEALDTLPQALWYSKDEETIITIAKVEEHWTVA